MDQITPAQHAQVIDDFETSLGELSTGRKAVGYSIPHWLIDAISAETEKYSAMVGQQVSLSFVVTELLAAALVPQIAANHAADLPATACLLAIYGLAAEAQGGNNELADIEDLFKSQEGKWHDVALFLTVRHRAWQKALDRAAAVNGGDVVAEAEQVALDG